MMLTTILTIAICTTCICAIAGAWDAARRYIEMRRFNQDALTRIERAESDLDALRTQVKALGEKFAMANAGSLSRLGRSVGSRT